MADEHMNWARKHRPKSLNEYMGDEIKQKMLSRLKDPKDYPRVILLEGDRGSGKTSLARLISVELLCEDKVDGRACGKCAMCQELQERLLFADNGSTTDNVLEVNVATDNGKSAVETVMDEMDAEPLYGNYKICILDECHRLSKAAQNALLKRLEEPKPYEVYILCTTDPDDLIAPIKSRCEVRLQVKPASIDDLTNRLIEICKIEGVETSREALRALGNACGRNPRESILKLEDIAKSHGYKVLLDDVLRETGTIEADTYISYFTAVNKGMYDIVKFVGDLKEKNIQGNDFLKGLTNFVISCIYIRMGINLDRYQKDYVDRVKAFFNMYTTEDIDTLLQILEYARKIVTSDESMVDLVMLTTSMRIGKIKLLAVGLYNEAVLADKENAAGNRKHVAQLNAEKDKSNESVRGTRIDDGMMASTFGKQLVEINAQAPRSLFEDDDDDDEDDTDDRTLGNDDSFLEEFSSRFNVQE